MGVGAGLIVACGGGGDGGTTAPPGATRATVATVTVTLSVGQLAPGATTNAVALVQSSDGGTLTGRAVQWASSAANIATVDASGVVVAVASGTTTISATSEGRTGAAQLIVAPVPVASVSMSIATNSIAVGASTQATATVRDANGASLSGRALVWATASAAIASVDQNGLVTGLAIGATSITATSEGRTGTVTLSVTPPPVATVDVVLSLPVIPLGSSTTAVATVRDVAGNVLTGRSVTWESSAPAVATVSVTGLITTLAVGNAVITATSERKSGSANLKVQPAPVATVVVSGATGSLLPGQIRQFNAVLRDAGNNVLTDRLVVWTSNNSAVANVDVFGSVTGIGTGVATITATSEGRYGIVTVSVASPIATVVFTGTTRIKAGDPYTYTATARTADGTVVVRPVLWSVKQPGMGGVSTSGVLVAAQAGTLTLQATIDGVLWDANYTAYDWESRSITGSNFVSLYADNQITNKYGTSEYPRLVFVCDISGYFFSWVSTQNFVTKNGTVAVLFDDGPAVTQSWTELSDFSTLAIPGSNATVKSFAVRVASSQLFGFGFTEYLGSAKAMIFRVTGLASRLQPLLAQCPSNSLLRGLAQGDDGALAALSSVRGGSALLQGAPSGALDGARAERRAVGSVASPAPSLNELAGLRVQEVQNAVRRP